MAIDNDYLELKPSKPEKRGEGNTGPPAVGEEGSESARKSSANEWSPNETGFNLTTQNNVASLGSSDIMVGVGDANVARASNGASGSSLDRTREELKQALSNEEFKQQTGLQTTTFEELLNDELGFLLAMNYGNKLENRKRAMQKKHKTGSPVPAAEEYPSVQEKHLEFKQILQEIRPEPGKTEREEENDLDTNKTTDHEIMASKPDSVGSSNNEKQKSK